MNVHDVVGYLYAADTYCPACAVMAAAESLAEDGHESLMGPVPTQYLVDPDAGLDRLAEIAGIDRATETSYESDDFPKVIFRMEAEESNAACGNIECGRPLAQ